MVSGGTSETVFALFFYSRVCMAWARPSITRNQQRESSRTFAASNRWDTFKVSVSDIQRLRGLKDCIFASNIKSWYYRHYGQQLQNLIISIIRLWREHSLFWNKALKVHELRNVCMFKVVQRKECFVYWYRNKITWIWSTSNGLTVLCIDYLRCNHDAL